MTVWHLVIKRSDEGIIILWRPERPSSCCTILIPAVHSKSFHLFFPCDRDDVIIESFGRLDLTVYCFQIGRCVYWNKKERRRRRRKNAWNSVLQHKPWQESGLIDFYGVSFFSLRPEICRPVLKKRPSKRTCWGWLHSKDVAYLS